MANLEQKTSNKKGKEGKKRKNKRSCREAQAAQIRVEAKPDTFRSPNIIQRKDFVPLAEFVSSSSQWHGTVPPAVAAALDRCTILRKAVGEFIKSPVGSRVRGDNSDRGHAYFIDPHLPKLSSNNQSTSLEPLADSLNGFVLEEPRSDSVSEFGDLDFSFEDEKIEDSEEYFVAFYFLLSDFSKLRKAVSSMWTGYKGGKYGLPAVSVATDTAISFARCLEQDILRVWDSHVGISRLLEAYYVCLCSMQNESVDHRERPEDDMNFRTYDVAESVVWPTYRILESFVELLKPGMIPIYETGSDSKNTSFSRTRNVTLREKYLNDKTFLL